MTHETTVAETELRLRAKPAPVMRLSRRALALVSGVAAAAILAAVAFAMTSRQTSDEILPKVAPPGPPPESLRALPADYKGPVLGRPLPGDLGRPILAAEQAQASETPVAPPTSSPAIGPSEATQRSRAERDAARRSSFFLPTARPAASVNVPGMAAPFPIPADLSLGMPQVAAGGQDTVNPARLTDPASPYILQAGAMIPAALVTGVRSDLPGQVVAQVTEPIYDSPSGRVLLIPQGARLLGTYDDRVAFGQRRVHLVWTRLILPNGRSLVLGEAPAGDAAGYSGLQDRVDRRWGQLFGMAALSTVLSFGAELGADSDSDLVQAIRRGGVDTFNQVGQQAVGKALAVAPALTIRPGTPVRLIVTQDLVLEPFQERHP